MGAPSAQGFDGGSGGGRSRPRDDRPEAGRSEGRLARIGPADERVEVLVQCVCAGAPGTAPAMGAALERLLAHGAIPFEVVVGTPYRRFGPRITCFAADDPRELADAAGYGRHPWGPPDWIGLRIPAGGPTGLKPYHWLDHRRPIDDLAPAFVLPEHVPDGLVPVMASLDGARRELYLRLGPALTWTAFARAGTALLPAAASARPVFSPHPRPAPLGFGLSLSWTADRLDCVTLYADQDCLWDDGRVGAAWTAGMGHDDRRAYEVALAGVRSLGPCRPDAWHAMLAWTLTADGEWYRSVSLRVPRLAAPT